MTTELKETHRIFVDAYMGDCKGNGTEAARVAGYSGDNAALAVRASELLKRDDVKTAMQERVEADPRVMNRQEEQLFLSCVARGENTDGKKIKISWKDRLEALKTLMRSQGAFVEKREVKHTGEVVFYIPKNGREAPEIGDGDDE